MVFSFYYILRNAFLLSRKILNAYILVILFQGYFFCSWKWFLFSIPVLLLWLFKRNVFCSNQNYHTKPLHFFFHWVFLNIYCICIMHIKVLELARFQAEKKYIEKLHIGNIIIKQMCICTYLYSRRRQIWLRSSNGHKNNENYISETRKRTL